MPLFVEADFCHRCQFKPNYPGESCFCGASTSIANTKKRTKKAQQNSPKIRLLVPSNHPPQATNKEEDFISGHKPDKDEVDTNVHYDLDRISTWVYPHSRIYAKREYQCNIVRSALFKNTLVVLPTGLGKTFIAAVVMVNYIRWFPNGKIIFMAPTRPLVTQQIKACHNIVGIDEKITAQLMGNIPSSKRKELWQSRRVFYCTPQTVEKDSNAGLLPTSKISLLVIDEAHRATGNYAYTRVVQYVHSRHKSFRVLALSATPGKNAEKVQEVITNLLIASVEYKAETDPDVKPYVFDKLIEIRKVPNTEECFKLSKLLNAIAAKPLYRLCSKKASPLLKWDVRKISKERVIHAQKQFYAQGMGTIQESFAISADFGLLAGLLHLRSLLEVHGISIMYEQILKKWQLPLKEKSSKAKLSLLQTDEWKRFVKQVEEFKDGLTANPKVNELIKVLKEHFHRYKMSNEQTSVIVFTQYRTSVCEIVNTINRTTNLKASPFVGQSNNSTKKKQPSRSKVANSEVFEDIWEMPESVAITGQNQRVQQKVVQEFRRHEIDVLVSTSIGEEGLDIGSVDLIIAYDALTSPVRMIQRFGRAGRKRSGKVICLVAEGKEKETLTSGTAKSHLVHKLLREQIHRLRMFHDNDRMVPKSIHPRMIEEIFAIKEFHSSQVAGRKASAKKQPRKKEKSRSLLKLSDVEQKYYLSNLHCNEKFNVGSCLQSASGEFQRFKYTAHSSRSLVLQKLLCFINESSTDLKDVDDIHTQNSSGFCDMQEGEEIHSTSRDDLDHQSINPVIRVHKDSNPLDDTRPLPYNNSNGRGSFEEDSRLNRGLDQVQISLHAGPSPDSFGAPEEGRCMDNSLHFKHQQKICRPQEGGYSVKNEAYKSREEKISSISGDSCTTLVQKCSACGGGGGTIKCYNCKIFVHPRCCGRAAGLTSWQCALCESGNMSQTIKCFICGKCKSLGMMRFCPNRKFWFHISCALWTSAAECSWDAKDYTSDVNVIEKTATSNTSCEVCRQSTGLKVECSVDSCCVTYHASCAIQEGYYFKYERAMPTSYCKGHSEILTQQSQNLVSACVEKGTEGEGRCNNSFTTKKGTTIKPPLLKKTNGNLDYRIGKQQDKENSDTSCPNEGNDFAPQCLSEELIQHEIIFAKTRMETNHVKEGDSNEIFKKNLSPPFSHQKVRISAETSPKSEDRSISCKQMNNQEVERYCAVSRIPCDVCGDADREEDFLLCEDTSTATHGAHYDCLNLKNIPKDEWWCVDHISKKPSRDLQTPIKCNTSIFRSFKHSDSTQQERKFKRLRKQYSAQSAKISKALTASGKKLQKAKLVRDLYFEDQALCSDSDTSDDLLEVESNLDKDLPGFVVEDESCTNTPSLYRRSLHDSGTPKFLRRGRAMGLNLPILAGEFEKLSAATKPQGDILNDPDEGNETNKKPSLDTIHSFKLNTVLKQKDCGRHDDGTPQKNFADKLSANCGVHCDVKRRIEFNRQNALRKRKLAKLRSSQSISQSTLAVKTHLPQLDSHSHANANLATKKIPYIIWIDSANLTKTMSTLIAKIKVRRGRVHEQTHMMLQGADLIVGTKCSICILSPQELLQSFLEVVDKLEKLHVLFSEIKLIIQEQSNSIKSIETRLHNQKSKLLLESFIKAQELKGVCVYYSGRPEETIDIIEDIAIGEERKGTGLLSLGVSGPAELLNSNFQAQQLMKFVSSIPGVSPVAACCLLKHFRGKTLGEMLNSLRVKTLTEAVPGLPNKQAAMIVSYVKRSWKP